MRSPAIVAAASPSGSTIVTCAPAPRAAAASIAVAARHQRASPRKRSAGAASSAAVGTKQSTRLPALTGAMSRLVGLHTPPSTYSRSPIRTGRKTPGTAHEAATASATPAAGAPGLPKTTRRPSCRSTAATSNRPSNRAPHRAMRARSASRAMRPSGTRPRSTERTRAPAGEPTRRAAAAGNPTPRVTRPRRGRGRHSAPTEGPETAVLPDLPGGSSGRPATSLAATMEPAEVPTKHRVSRKSMPLRAEAPAR